MTEIKKFQRTKEDFTCENCKHFVEGTGYTNHCPQCLWGKHVDINPGDRRESCHGLMKPTEIQQKKGGHKIQHTCTKCGLEKINKTAKNDDFSTVLKLSSNPQTKI